MQGYSDAYNGEQRAFQDLYKALAKSGKAPSDYISQNMLGNGFAQGPNIPDSMDGEAINRYNLYWASDNAAKIRQALRENLEVQGDYDDERADGWALDPVGNRFA